jgi:hypothetical protein
LRRVAISPSRTKFRIDAAVIPEETGDESAPTDETPAEAVLNDRQAVRNFSQRVEKTWSPMELRYMRDVADDRGLDWEYTERVLSSRDLDEWMRQGW